jgi:hypothetical protein
VPPLKSQPSSHDFTNTGGITYTGAGTVIRSAPRNTHRTLVGSAGGTIDLSAGGRLIIAGGETRLTNSAKTDWTSNEGSLTVSNGARLNLWDSGVAATEGQANTNVHRCLDGNGTIWRTLLENNAASPASTLIMGVANTDGNYNGSISDFGTNVGNISIEKRRYRYADSGEQ